MVQQLLQSNYPLLQETLLKKIREATEAERIFILAAVLTKQQLLTSFNKEHTSLLLVSGLLILLVTGKESVSIHDMESHVEHCCGDLLPVTAIVIRTRQFDEWSAAGHPFIYTVQKKSIIAFEKDTIETCHPGQATEDKKEKEKLLLATINRAEEFLAGAELFQLRKQNAMAAFMLHQAAEQCLRVLLEITTGYYCNTHSIERLLRVNTFLYPCLSAIFAQHSEKDKIQMQLLQKAYIDTRYKEDYCIHRQNLIVLTERVTRLKELLKQEGTIILHTMH